MVTKQDIELWLDEGYNLLQNGNPLKIDGDIWDYINNLDLSKNNIFVLREIINWEEEEIAKI